MVKPMIEQMQNSVTNGGQQMFNPAMIEGASNPQGMGFQPPMMPQMTQKQVPLQAKKCVSEMKGLMEYISALENEEAMAIHFYSNVSP